MIDQLKLAMKNLLSTLCFLILSFASIHAQVSFGLKAGITSAQTGFAYEGGYSLKSKSLTSIHGGIVTAFPLGSKFSLQPEFLYTGKGLWLQEDSTLEHSIEAHYISLPVMLGYTINKFTIKAGPEFNLRVASSSDITPLIHKDDIFKPTEISFAGGIAFRFLEKFGTEFRYSHGLTEALNFAYTDANGNEFDDAGGRKFRAMQLSIYYMLKK